MFKITVGWTSFNPVCTVASSLQWPAPRDPCIRSPARESHKTWQHLAPADSVKNHKILGNIPNQLIDLSAGILTGMNLTNLLFLIVFCLPILFHDPPVLPKQSGLDSGRMTLCQLRKQYITWRQKRTPTSDMSPPASGSLAAWSGSNLL